MSISSQDLIQIYHHLMDEFGPQYWWPADTPFEVIVGALLTQQTKWTNVEKAISNLKNYNLLNKRALANTDIETIEELIYCCGFYRQKAARLKNVATYFSENGLDTVFSQDIDELRTTLLSLKGIGEETADSIILYSAGKPKFVIDAYTKRIMGCLGVKGNYNQLQSLFESKIPVDVKLYQEYHALIVEYAKKYCVKKQCDNCLLLETDINSNQNI